MKNSRSRTGSFFRGINNVKKGLVLVFLLLLSNNSLFASTVLLGEAKTKPRIQSIVVANDRRMITLVMNKSKQSRETQLGKTNSKPAATDWANGSFWVKDLNNKGLGMVETFTTGALISSALNIPIEYYPAADPEAAPYVIKALVFLAWANHLASNPICEERRAVFIAKLKEAIATCQEHYSSLLGTEPMPDDYFLFKNLQYAALAIPTLGLTEEDRVDFSWIRAFLKRYQLPDGAFPESFYNSNIGKYLVPGLWATKNAVHALRLLGEDNATLFNKCIEFVLSMHRPNSSDFQYYPTHPFNFFATLEALPTLVTLEAPIPDYQLIVEKAVAVGTDLSYVPVRPNMGMTALFTLGEDSLFKSSGIQAERRTSYRIFRLEQGSMFGTWALAHTSYWAMCGIAPADFDFRLAPAKLPLNKSVRVTLEITNRHPRPRLLQLIGLEPMPDGGSFEVSDFPELTGEWFEGNESRVIEFTLKKTFPGKLMFNLVTRREILNWYTMFSRECHCSTVFELEEGEAKGKTNSALIIAGVVLGSLLVVGSTTVVAIIISLKKRKKNPEREGI